MLYHFTSEERLTKILADGYLRPTARYLPTGRNHASHAVVWFTSEPDPLRVGHGLVGDVAVVAAIRFAVELNRRTHRTWYPWARSRELDLAWLASFNASPGSSSWWITTHRVPVSDWLEVVDLRTNVPVNVVSTR